MRVQEISTASDLAASQGQGRQGFEVHGAFRAKNVKNTEKARGSRRSRGVWGGSRGSRGGPGEVQRFWAENS